MTQPPIALYYWPTPNGFKISIALEDKPHFARWLRACAARPAVRRGRLLHARLRPSFEADRPGLEALLGARLEDLMAG